MITNRAPAPTRRRSTGGLTGYAAAITNPYVGAQALIELAPHLSAELVETALATATAISDDFIRAQALAGLTPSLAPGQRASVLSNALAAAASVTDDSI